MARQASLATTSTNPSKSRKRKLPVEDSNEVPALRQIAPSVVAVNCSDQANPPAQPNQPDQPNRPDQPNHPDQPNRAPPHFSQSQFALALCIVKSKPVDISTRDYLDGLRKRIKTSTGGANGEGQPHRYIDTAEFWKDQYEKMRLEKNAWEGKANALVSVRRSLERIRGVGESPAVEPLVDLYEGQLGYKPFTCITLLRQTQYLTTQLTNTTIDAPTMLKSLQTTLLQMSSLITQICEPRTKQLTLEEEPAVLRLEQVEGAMHTVGLTYHQCLRGFKHLCRDIPGRLNKNLVIYSFSKLFSEALGYIHKTCEASVTDSKRSNAPTASRKGKEKENAAIGESSGTRYDVINMSLSKLLVVMMTSKELEESAPGHVEILEGYLFHLLRSTGTTLSEIVFHDQVSSSPSNPPSNLPSETHPPPSPKSKPDPVAQAKARYLVYILKHVIKDNPKVSDMLNSMVVSSSTAGKKSSVAATRSRGKKVLGNGNGAAGNGVLGVEVKRRLQDTLMLSVFGSTSDFPNSLKEPTPPDAGIIVELGKREEVEQGGSEWFVESLWSLIGWDVLAEKL